MTASSSIPFVKMNGLGNLISVVDLRETAVQFSGADAARLALIDHFDQAMVLSRPKTAGTMAFVRIFNTDGSEAGACGNGTRCIALLEYERTGQNLVTFETAAGLVTADVRDARHITVDMGPPRFDWAAIPLAEPFQDTRAIELQIGPIEAPVLHSPSVVNVGNPHAVFWVDDTPDAYDLGRFGPMLENHPIFPERANISLAQVRSRSAIALRTWERGAGLTQACGSAACAAVACAIRKRLTDRSVTVTLPGGDMLITLTDENRILMTGPAEIDGRGVFAMPVPVAAHRG